MDSILPSDKHVPLSSLSPDTGGPMMSRTYCLILPLNLNMSRSISPSQPFFRTSPVLQEVFMDYFKTEGSLIVCDGSVNADSHKLSAPHPVNEQSRMNQSAV